QIRLGQSKYTSQKPVDILTLDYSKPQKYRIAEIEAVGLSTLDGTAIISLSGLKVDDTIDVPGDAISNALKRLWGQGIIGDVKILVTKVEGDDIYLLLDLTERPRFSRVEFTGVNSTQKSELEDKIEIRGRILRDDVLNNAQRNITRYFVDKGYLNTTVKVVQERDTTLPNSVQLRFDVDKGSKVRINAINIEGNEEIPDRRIKKRMKGTNEHARVHIFKDLFARLFNSSPKKIGEAIAHRNPVTNEEVTSYIQKNIKLNFFNASKFVRSDFRDDKESIIDFYNSRGYRDAEILRDSVFTFDTNTINIDIDIEEGQQYYYRNISFVGNYIHDDEVLRSTLGIAEGEIYNREKLDQRINYDPQRGDDVSSL